MAARQSGKEKGEKVSMNTPLVDLFPKCYHGSQPGPQSRSAMWLAGIQ